MNTATPSPGSSRAADEAVSATDIARDWSLGQRSPWLARQSTPPRTRRERNEAPTEQFPTALIFAQTYPDAVPAQARPRTQRPVTPLTGQEVRRQPPSPLAAAPGATKPPHLTPLASPSRAEPASTSLIRYTVSRYRGSDRLADLVLTATFCRDMHRSAVRNPERVAWVVGCMLLAELSQLGQVRVGHDGRLHPVRGVANDDPVLMAVLAKMQAEPFDRAIVKWLEYLAQDDRSTLLVWQRLVQAGAAASARKQRLRRHPRLELTELRATRWAHLYFQEQVIDLRKDSGDTEVPPGAVLVWRGLRELHLDVGILDLDPDIALQLEHAPFPAEQAPLFDALSNSLARLAASF